MIGFKYSPNEISKSGRGCCKDDGIESGSTGREEDDFDGHEEPGGKCGAFAVGGGG
jgi:hypothetical protein